MKYMFASDIHGSAYYCRKLLEAYRQSGAERLILLGDILYHGPRNDLPREYAPKEVISMLNPMKQELLAVRGNCEAEVDQMVLDLVDKKLVTDQIVLTVGYDIENLNNADRRKQYRGEVTIDRYGRRIPKHAHGTTNLKRQTSSTKLITDAVIELYDRIVDRNLLIRRINITANRLVNESSVKKEEVYEQMDLFTDYEAQRKKKEEEEAALDREKRMQEAMLSIKKKFGKNAVLKGMNLQEGATARDRNEQIGGHRA